MSRLLSWLLLILAFPALAAEPTKPYRCGQIFPVLDPAVVPVEKYYPKPPFSVGADGTVLFHRGSKAFIYWRSRLAPHHDDREIVGQYLGYSKDTAILLIKDAGRRPREVPDGEPATAIEALRRRSTWTPAQLIDLLRAGASEGAAERVFLENKFANPYFLLYRLPSGVSVRFFIDLLHQTAWEKLRGERPDAKYLASGAILFDARGNGDEAISVFPARVTNGGFASAETSDDALAAMLSLLREAFALPPSRQVTVEWKTGSKSLAAKMPLNPRAR